MVKAHAGRGTAALLECPLCHQQQLARIARRGLLRERLYPVLGLFPWQCGICGEEFLIRNRGRIHRDRPGRTEPKHAPGTPGLLQR